MARKGAVWAELGAGTSRYSQSKRVLEHRFNLEIYTECTDIALAGLPQHPLWGSLTAYNQYNCLVIHYQVYLNPFSGLSAQTYNTFSDITKPEFLKDEYIINSISYC